MVKNKISWFRFSIGVLLIINGIWGLSTTNPCPNCCVAVPLNKVNLVVGIIALILGIFITYIEIRKL